MSGSEAPNNHLIYATCSPVWTQLLCEQLCSRNHSQYSHVLVHNTGWHTRWAREPSTGPEASFWSPDFWPLYLLKGSLSASQAVWPKQTPPAAPEFTTAVSREQPGRAPLGGNSKPSKEESPGEGRAGCSRLVTGQGGGRGGWGSSGQEPWLDQRGQAGRKASFQKEWVMGRQSNQ